MLTAKAITLFALAAAVSCATAVDVTSADVTDYASLIAGVFTPGSAGANALGDALQFNFGDIGDGDGGTSSTVADDLAVKPLTLGTLSDFSPDFVADFAKTAARAVKAAPLGALGGDIKQLLDDATRAGAKLAQTPQRIASQLGPGGAAADALALLVGAGDGAASVRDAFMDFSIPVTGLRAKLEDRLERAVNAGDGGDAGGDDGLGDLLSFVGAEVNDGAQALLAALGPAMTQALQGTGTGGGGRRLRGEGGNRRRLLEVARSLSDDDDADYKPDGPGGKRHAVVVSVGTGASLLTCCSRGLDHVTGECKASTSGSTSVNAEFSFNIDVAGFSFVFPQCPSSSFQKEANKCPKPFVSFDTGFGGTVTLTFTDGKYVVKRTKGGLGTGSLNGGRSGGAGAAAPLGTVVGRRRVPTFMGSSKMGNMCRWALKSSTPDAAAVSHDSGKTLSRPSLSIGLIFDYLGVAGTGIDLDIEADFGKMTAPGNNLIKQDDGTWDWWKRLLPVGVKFMLSDDDGSLEGFALVFDPLTNLKKKWEGTVRGRDVSATADFTDSGSTLADENNDNNVANAFKQSVLAKANDARAAADLVKTLEEQMRWAATALNTARNDLSSFIRNVRTVNNWWSKYKCCRTGCAGKTVSYCSGELQKASTQAFAPSAAELAADGGSLWDMIHLRKLARAQQDSNGHQTTQAALEARAEQIRTQRWQRTTAMGTTTVDSWDTLDRRWAAASPNLDAQVTIARAVPADSADKQLAGGALGQPLWPTGKCSLPAERGGTIANDYQQGLDCRETQRRIADALITAYQNWGQQINGEASKGQTYALLAITTSWSYSLALPGTAPEPSVCTQAPHFYSALLGAPNGGNWFPYLCRADITKADVSTALGSPDRSAWKDLVLPECWCHEINDEADCNKDDRCMFVDDAARGCVSRWGTRDTAEWESDYCPARRRRLRGPAAATGALAGGGARALASVGDTASTAAREVGMKFLLGYLQSGRLQTAVCLGKDAHCEARDTRRSVPGTVVVDPAAARGAELRLSVPAVKLGALAYMASGKHGEALLSAIGPVADVGLGDATLAVATTGTSLTMSASGSPLLGADGCKGVFACALANAGEGIVVSAASTVHTTGDAEVEMRYGVKPSGGGRVIFSDGMTPPKGPSFFTSVSLRNKIPTTKAGATLPVQVCVEDCAKPAAQRRYLHLAGEVYFGVSPIETTASGELSMLGWWDRAFGAPMVHIGDLKVRAGFDVKTWPPAPTQLELGGRACLGSKAACVDGAEGEMISALAYGGIGLTDPSGNYYVAMMTEVSIDKIFGVLGETMGEGNPFSGWRSTLPKGVKDSGVYPLDEDCTNAQNADPAGNPNCFARVSVAPLAPATVVTSSGTMAVPRGFALAGRLKVGGWTMGIEAKMTPTSFLVDAAMDPIKLGGLLQVTRSLGDTKNGPRFYMDFAVVPPKAAVEVRGAVQIPALGTEGECTVLLGADGYELSTRGKVFGALTADLETRWATGGSSSKGFAFAASVGMGDLASTVSSVADLVSDVLAEATKWADKIQDELDEAASYVKDACKRLKDKKKIDSAVYTLCKAAGAAAKATLTGVFAGAEEVLKAAKKAIDALAKAAVRNLGKADFFSVQKLGLGGVISDASTKTVAGKSLGDLKKSVYKGGSGCTTKTPCNVGEGDCDKDSECKGSYKCFQRGKNGANPPGVVLSADHKKGEADYCYNPKMEGVKLCSASQPCSEGQGDCDNDSECAGALKCFQRAANGPPPPGITLTSGLKKSASDFCYNPERFGSSRVNGDLEFTYFGKKAAKSFELDLSDAKDFASKMAKQVFAEIKKIWKKIADLPSAAEKEFNKIKNVVGDAIENAVKKIAADIGGAIVDGVVQAGKAIGGVAKDAGKAIGGAAKTTGKAIGGTAKKTGKSIKKFFGRRQLGTPYDFDSGVDMRGLPATPLRENGDRDAPRRLLTRRFE